jgi:PAS domain S-box-containing protein
MRDYLTIFDSLDLLSQIFHESGVGLAAADLNQTLLWCSDAFAALIGCTSQECVGLNTATFTAHEDLHITPKHLRHWLDRGGTARADCQRLWESAE